MSHVRIEQWRSARDARHRRGLIAQQSHDFVETLAGTNPLPVEEIMVRDFLIDFPGATEVEVRRGTKMTEFEVRRALGTMCFFARASSRRVKGKAETYTVPYRQN